MRKLFFLVFLFATLFSFSQVASRPSPEKLYNNLSAEFPNFLSSSEAEAIEQKLEAFSRETSNQIVVVIVDDIGGTDPASYATQLGTEWGVGRKGSNNGIVILIKPNTHDLFIAVGYGLEGAIPDLATKKIREEEMNPNFKSGDNFAAINNGTDKLMALAKGEINVKDYTKKKKDWFNTILIIALIIFLVYIFSGKGGSTGGGFSSGGAFFGGGGGSFRSSGGGGGFGGFGGGSFGGGGSGGKW